MTYATTDDVVALWAKEPEPEVLALISRRLAQVERMILRRVPDLADRITAGDVQLEDVVQVEADAVLRLVRNPEGYVSEQDGAYGYEIRRDLASGKLTILDEEWKLLGWTRSRMFTLDPRF